MKPNLRPEVERIMLKERQSGALSMRSSNRGLSQDGFLTLFDLIVFARRWWLRIACVSLLGAALGIVLSILYPTYRSQYVFSPLHADRLFSENETTFSKRFIEDFSEGKATQVFAAAFFEALEISGSKDSKRARVLFQQRFSNNSGTEDYIKGFASYLNNLARGEMASGLRFNQHLTFVYLFEPLPDFRYRLTVQTSEPGISRAIIEASSIALNQMLTYASELRQSQSIETQKILKRVAAERFQRAVSQLAEAKQTFEKDLVAKLDKLSGIERSLADKAKGGRDTTARELLVGSINQSIAPGMFFLERRSMRILDEISAFRFQDRISSDIAREYYDEVFELLTSKSESEFEFAAAWNAVGQIQKDLNQIWMNEANKVPADSPNVDPAINFENDLILEDASVLSKKVMSVLGFFFGLLLSVGVIVLLQFRTNLLSAIEGDKSDLNEASRQSITTL